MAENNRVVTLKTALEAQIARQALFKQRPDVVVATTWNTVIAVHNSGRERAARDVRQSLVHGQRTGNGDLLRGDLRSASRLAP